MNFTATEIGLECKTFPKYNKRHTEVIEVIT